MTKALPPRPHLDWLRKAAKARLNELHQANPETRLHEAQHAIAREYGFASWRALKARIDALAAAEPERARVFEAARRGDTERVGTAIARGFDVHDADAERRTIHQIAKEARFEAIELMARRAQEREPRPQAVLDAVAAIHEAALNGDAAALARRLDAHPELIDAPSIGIRKYAPLHRAASRSRHAALRLLIERGADLHGRDFPDNAYAIHVAAAVGDLETVRILAEAGSDLAGDGDDYGVGVLGWATCFRETRTEIAEELLRRGAKLNLWSAIALDRADEVRALLAADPALLSARMTRNLRRRTALHHAAAKNRPALVRLLLDLGADARATDATGATALTTATQENADPAIAEMLLRAGAPLDLLTAVNLGRFAEAEALLAGDPSRLGPDGRDTIALHLAVSRHNEPAIRWLIAHGVAVNAKRDMWDCNHTALHMTVESGALDIARLLLDAGADPNLRDDKYEATALGWAKFFGRPEFEALLKERGGVG